VERKLATVLFVDLVASTDLVAGSDPEVVRRRVTSFFDSVATCVVSHGGIVEKFAGDAVMAAFGVPLAHEDDAERAIRAALATLERVHQLGLEARIGVESGEVVADDSESTFATGEAVNVAARLQQEAGPGEVLIGPAADRLTRGLFDCERVGPLELRGFPEPIAACRIVGACPSGPALGSLSAPLVGREEELELLENTFTRTVRHGRTSLFTIYGEPGVGKSRLAREFIAGVEGATVLMGRCLPYGEGVTYWSLAEMVRASAGIADDDPAEAAKQKLRDCCEDEAVADLLALAAGVLEAVEGERAPQEISWAARAWAEQLAKAQPLVLVFEDIQWAEEPLLDLLEHLAAWVKDSPLMLLCIARPELLDVRPTWGGGRVRATAIELEPLPPAESLQLVTALLADREALVDIRAVLAKSEGNPLFVEETIRMLVEGGSGDGAGPDRIPDTLQALIAARIDRLPGEQRTLLQRASVIGRVFWSTAIVQLSQDLDDPQRALDGLLLRDLIVREQRSSISGEEAYKFKHVLIREVAYAGLTKSARAAHHASFAEWLHGRNRDDLLEIRAFHLDQAARLQQELEGAAPPGLAEEAAGALAKAGHRAMAREAYRSARKLHLRAAELVPTLENRYAAARAAWRLGDYVAVAAEMQELRAEAAGTDRKLEGRALTALADVALFQQADPVRAGELAERALETLEAGDVARFDAHWTRSRVASFLGDSVGFERAVKEALTVAQDAGRKDFEALATQTLAQSYLVRLELDEAEPLVERAFELAEAGGSVYGRAMAESARATLARMRGQLEESRDRGLAAISLLADLGFSSLEASAMAQLGSTLQELGDLEGAERMLRDGVRILSGAKDRAHLCEAQRLLAELLVEKDELAEAERHALAARETVGADDRFSVSTTKLALGLVRAAQGRDDEAEMLLQDAADELRSYGLASPERDAQRALAQFFRSRGRDAEAGAAEERLAELDARSTAPIA
jgi:class 3 adenylate cyclase/tetratricopeptide (TPR) repeat protein